MNNITSNSNFVRLVGLAALLALVMAVVSPLGATDYETLEIGSDTTMTDDHYGNIVITADNITLDCAGYSVIGPGSGSGIALENRTGVTVENCLTTGFEFGFDLTDATNNVLKRNQAEGNDEGFMLLQAHGNRLEHNTANEGDGGFWMRASTGNILIKNTALSNSSWPGFSVDAGSSNNELHENVAARNFGAGYMVVHSSNNVLKSNVATSNRGNGFRIGYAHNNQLIENTANNNTTNTWINGIGFNVFYSDSNLFRNNQANDNEVGGFGVLGSTGNSLIANVSAGNGNGIFIAASIQMTINDNQVIHNHGSGIYLVSGSENNSLSGNTAEENAGSGIVLLSSASNRLTDNVANSNLNDGFFIGEGSNANSLGDNEARYNALSGFSVYASSNNQLLENRAMHNKAFGFVLGDGDKPEGFISEFNSFVQNHGCQNQYYDGADYSAGTSNTWLDNKYCTFYDDQPS